MTPNRILFYITGITGVFIFAAALLLLIRSGTPSADTRWKEAEARPFIQTADFAPGDVKLDVLNGLLIVIWRRNEEDKRKAALQNDPADWPVKRSGVLGSKETVFADDENLTINGEWLLAVAHPNNHFWTVPQPRMGDFDGFFESYKLDHFDISGRIRTGPSLQNLTIVPAVMSEDEKSIQLDLRAAKEYIYD